AAGLIGQRQVQRKEVRSRVDLSLALDAFHAELSEPVGRDERVIRNDPHAEPRGAPGDLLADPAEAENAQRLVGELDPAVGLALPPALLEGCMSLWDVPRQRDEQADRVLRGGDDGGLR